MPSTPNPLEGPPPQVHRTPQAGEFPRFWYKESYRRPYCGARQRIVPGWPRVIAWHRRRCNSTDETRPLGCEPGCPLRDGFPETWESWNSKRFKIHHEGREKLVSGFFVDQFRYESTLCKVLGEVVDGKLHHRSKRIHRIDSGATAPHTMSPVPVSPCEQRVKRKHRKAVVRRPAKRVEPSPIANRTDSVTSPTRMQSENEYWRAASKWCNETFPDQPGDDAIDWSWMSDHRPLP
jgi:hypothetical protein